MELAAQLEHHGINGRVVDESGISSGSYWVSGGFSPAYVVTQPRQWDFGSAVRRHYLIVTVVNRTATWAASTSAPKQK